MVKAAHSSVPNVDDLAAQLAREHGGRLIQNLTTTQLDTVQKLIGQGIERDWTQATLSRHIRGVVGLDPRRAQAVDNLRTSLTTQKIAPGKINRMATAYAKRLVNERASLIADTEVRSLMAEAQRRVWLQEQAQGTLSRYAVRVTHVHKDDRLCSICRPQNGRRRSLQDAVGGPPFHPNCRCWEELSDQGMVEKADQTLWGPTHDQIEKAGVVQVSKQTPDFHDGIMVAVYPDSVAAQQVSAAIAGLTDPQPIQELHTTLLFLGKTQTATIHQNDLISAVQTAIAPMKPLVGQIAGLGIFPDSGDGVPVWAPVDVPGLSLLRELIASQLVGHFATDHGFTPHMTLGYDTEVPKPLAPIPVRFDYVSVVYGSERTDLVLGGG